MKRTFTILTGVLLALIVSRHSLAQRRQNEPMADRKGEVKLKVITDPKQCEQIREQIIRAVPDELNIARHKPVKTTAPSEGAHRAELAVDGSTDRDSSTWWGKGTPSWFQVDLGEPTSISAVHVFFYWDGKRYYQYTIDVSLDEETWQTVVDRSGNTTPSAPAGFAHAFPPVQARFVRVTVLKNSVNPSAHIVELKVYPGEGARSEPSAGVSPVPIDTGAPGKTSNPLSVADNGVLQLYFGEGMAQLVAIHSNGKWLGSVYCAVAQFEKEGMGYKGAGMGSARATLVKKVSPVKPDAQACAVDVVVERTRSEETKRKFEATYRFTLHPGQNWLESRLMQIRNTDTMPYDVRGYYHLIQPADVSSWDACCFAEVAGWIGASGLLGVMTQTPGDFVLGLRKASGTTRGEITRSIKGCRINPNMTWEGQEPGLIIFADEESTAESLVRESERIRSLLSSTPAKTE